MDFEQKSSNLCLGSADLLGLSCQASAWLGPVHHFSSASKGFHRGWHAAVNAGVQQHLLDFFHRGAVVQRPAHMAFELVLFAQRGQHGHRDQAACFQVQAWPLPGVAPGVAGDVLLYWLGKRRGSAQRFGNKVVSHDALAHGQASVIVFGGDVCHEKSFNGGGFKRAGTTW